MYPIKGNSVKKINIIVLASGFSRRFNGNKLLTCFKGIPLIEHTFKKLSSLEVNEVIVVSQYEQLLTLAKKYHFNTIYNHEPFLGQSNSIKLGVKASQSCEGVMLLVGDLPYLKETTLTRLIEMFNQLDHQAIVVSECEGIMQNPVIFSKCYFEELLNLSGDQGAKKVFKQHLENVTSLEVEDPLELVDIDYRDQIEDENINCK